ncbi:MMPL family transporter [Nocardia sp. NPDC051981]|uniref:MMPL family transporter n=1 Tax=Nocardia sp. NPDC051981 TaxID=3155417 RepID=UPI00342F0D71
MGKRLRRMVWAAITFWVVAIVATGGLAGKLGSAEKNDATTWLPKSAESTQNSSHHDRNLVVPLVLSVVFLITAILLRSLVAPAMILSTVVLSLAAALGVSAVAFDKLFGFHGADAAFPLWTFVFLVSLGIDYSIFLMARIREESTRHDTTTATVIAARTTSGTITAAGVVLAGTFAALLTLPLVFAAQIGFAVAFGVLLDTFVVRTILVPALAMDLGDRLWWPRHRANTPNSGRELVSPGSPE